MKISEATRDKILGGKKPVKVVGLITQNMVINNLQNLFKSDNNFIAIDADGYYKAQNKYVCEMVKWMKHKSPRKFHVSPKSTMKYSIVGLIGDICSEMITVDVGQKLPMEKIVEIPKTFKIYRIVLTDEHGTTIMESKQMAKKCHKIQITFKIDAEHFYSCTTRNIISPKIKGLPRRLDQFQQSKIPVIVFWDNSSVICVSKNGGNYKFCEKWNGLCGNALFINFNKKRPFLDTNITVETKMDTVVFDFLKILSMPIDNIEIDEGWKFRFTKDAENPCLIEFTNFDGEKKAATPTLLMAILLRQHLKIITEEIGQKPKQIGISCIDNFNAGERKRVEEKIQESCQLLNIQCNFIRT
uniref:Uncharacterized protein n=1 Tax=Panagrolaimus sp. ES5 TaxID=591445 RepID=A0AC34G0B2_9BILA